MKLPNNPKILAATYNPTTDTKIMSVLVDFPTVLLAELRTHRILAQGAAYEHLELTDFGLSANSARAIPYNKYLEKVMSNPFVPIWTKQQKGMSGEMLDAEMPTEMWKQFLEGYDSQMSIEVNSNTTINNVCFDVNSPESSGWVVDYKKLGIVDMYKYLLQQHVHKQNANRLLAPFAWTTCILSGTEWDNFFNLRCPKYEYDGMTFLSWKDLIKEISLEGDLQTYNPRIYEMNNDPIKRQEINTSTAQPEFQVIAEQIYDLYCEANWKESKYHIPFEEDIKNLYWKQDLDKFPNYKFGIEEMEMMMKISASMCAKLSYNTQDNEDTLEKHLERADMLIKHKHWEPFVHQAIAMDNDEAQAFTYTHLTKIKPDSINGQLTKQRGTVSEYKNNYIIAEHGWCFPYRGFISHRYMLENQYFSH